MAYKIKVYYTHHAWDNDNRDKDYEEWDDIFVETLEELYEECAKIKARYHTGPLDFGRSGTTVTFGEIQLNPPEHEFDITLLEKTITWKKHLLEKEELLRIKAEKEEFFKKKQEELNQMNELKTYLELKQKYGKTTI